MQNDRSSSQFSLHLQYISRKEMITARKEDDSFDTVISCNSFLPRRGIKIWGEEWKKNKRWNAEERGPIPRPSIEILPSTRVTILFSIFFKIFAFNFKDRRNSTRFSSVSRVVTLRGKKKKRENKREEKERGGEMEGSEGGRRRKQRGEERVAHNGANEKEEGERVRKRKKNRRGRDVSSRAFHFPCLSFLPSPPARQRSFRRGTRSQVFSGPIRDEVSNGKFERINHFPRG